MKKSIVAAAVSIAVMCSIAQTNSTKVAAIQRITGGIVEQALPDDARKIVLVDARAQKDDELKAFKDRIATLIAAPSVISSEADASTFSITLADGGDFVVRPDKMAAVVPAQKDGAETQKCLMKALFCLFAAEDLLQSQAGMMMAQKVLKAHNIPAVRRTSYKKACEEGWAPAPTNDIQKAIWDRVKAEKEAAAKPAEVTETK